MSELLENPETVLTGETVTTGSIVELRYFDGEDDDTEVVQIISKHDQNKLNSAHLRSVLSDSPLGAAIIGKSVGNIVKYTAQNNMLLAIEIVSVK